MTATVATETAQGYTATTDTKVGDLVTITVIEGRRAASGGIDEVPVQNTFRVESVDNLNGNLWCRGTVVESTSPTPAHYVGRQGCAYIGKVAA